MTNLLPTILSAVITAVVSAVSVYVSLNSRIAVIETKIDTLSKRVEKHNNMVERTYILERDVKTIFNQLEDIKQDIHNLEQRV
jgi:5-bromo-4-chloroindolyl phosphate hydrolysis protein